MAEAALFVLVQIPFGVDVNPVDNNTNMQMISGHIAGSTDFGIYKFFKWFSLLIC